MKKKSNKKSKKWKPKYKWIESITINLKTKKYKYFTPKIPEEEKSWKPNLMKK